MKRIKKANQLDKHHIFKIPGSGRIWWGISLIFGLLFFLLLVMAGEKSLFKVVSLYKERDHLNFRIADITNDNQKLNYQIEQLRTDTKAVERIAREELGMVQPDEIVYRFISPEEMKQYKSK